MDEPEIIIRDRDNLDDYLYEPYSKYTSKDAEKVCIFRVLISYSIDV